MTPLERALSYLARGWCPVPIPYREKRPVLDGWERLRLTPESAAQHWNGVPANIGIILGEASGGLADVDLDCAEALELAPRILPPTCSFGRATNPDSHWEYISPGATTKQFRDDQHQTLVELRATAPRTGNGQQSVFPGSTHKDTGEPIEWTPGKPSDLACVQADELRRMVTRLAIACLLKRRSPEHLEPYLAGDGALPPGVPEPLTALASDWLGTPTPKPKQSAANRSRSPALADYGHARARFNQDHPFEADNRGRACPAEGCEGKNSFKGDALKATCFHSSHPDGCGTRCTSGGTDCFVLDPLDLEAHNCGRDPTEHLIADGYWARPEPRQEPPAPGDDEAPPWLYASPAPAPSRIPGEDDDVTTPVWVQPRDAQGQPAGLPYPAAARARFAPKTDLEITRALEDLRRRSGSSRNQRLAFVDWADLRHKRFDKPVWSIRGVLPHMAVAATGGEPKANKTWVLLEAAVAMATATPMFGEFLVAERMPVALVLTEDDEQNIRNRIRSLIAGRNLPSDAADGWLFTITRAELNVLNEPSVADLVAACRRLPRRIGMLGLDPLRNLHSGDENDSTEMIRLMAQLRALRDVLCCSVCFNHHTIKASKDTSDRRPGQKMRGSSAIHGAVDAGFYMSDCSGDGRSTWTNKVDVEIKGARGAGCFDLRLEVRDDDNDEAAWAQWTVEGLGREGRMAKETQREEERRARKAAEDAARTEAKEQAHTALVDRLVALMGPAPIGIETLRARLRVGSGKAREALETAHVQGKVNRVMAGAKLLGWVASEAPNTVSLTDPDRPGPEPDYSTPGSLTDSPSPYVVGGEEVRVPTGQVSVPRPVDTTSQAPQPKSRLTPEERARLLEAAKAPVPDSPLDTCAAPYVEALEDGQEDALNEQRRLFPAIVRKDDP